MKIDDNLLNQITRRITGVLPVDRIILFGSAATGEMTRDSDIDLLIIRQDIHDHWGDCRRIREALLDVAIPFDVILMTADRFEETKGIVGGLAYPAHKHGKVIYEAA